MVKSAIVSAMSPMASSRLLNCRWSWAPRRHSQPEMAARGVMKRKHTMSQNRVLFSLRGPGSFSHCGEGGRKGRQRLAERTGGQSGAVRWELPRALPEHALNSHKPSQKWSWRMTTVFLTTSKGKGRDNGRGWAGEGSGGERSCLGSSLGERAAGSGQGGRFSKAWLSRDQTPLGLNFNKNTSRTLQPVQGLRETEALRSVARPSH